MSASTQSWMVDGVHDGNQHTGQGRTQPARTLLQPVDKPERQGDEVVGNLLLGELV